MASSGNQRLCLIVTGASRGLGRAIAVAFCRHERFRRDVVVVHQAVLVARSATGLQETASLLQGITPSASIIKVSQVVADLGDLDALDATLDCILGHCDAIASDRLIFVNNAGSLGHLGPCLDSPSLQDMQKTIDLNVTGALWASMRVARWAVERKISNAAIVNISSLVAVQPFPTMAVYSAGKAARDSYHTAMAAELNSSSICCGLVKVLNYAPGPLETDMATELRQADALDANLKPHFCKQLVDPMDSAAALVKLLIENSFESGSHVDYFDIVQQAESETTGMK